MRFSLPLFFRALVIFTCAWLLVTPAWPAGRGDSVVTFNELHYHPASEGTEWIELHNQMSIPIDLSRWTLDEAVTFTFPAGTVIEPKGFVVIAGGPLEDSLGAWSGNLGNGGETLLLRDGNGRIMDEMTYDDEGDWPLTPDGGGVTLAKKKPFAASCEPSSWAGSRTLEGTPGAPNTVADETLRLAFSEIGGAATPDSFWIEWANRTDTSLDLGSFSLMHDGVRIPLPEESLAPGALFVMETGDLLPEVATGNTLILLDENSFPVDAVTIKTRPRSRLWEPNDVEWFFSAQETPGENNAIVLETDIVINEIMYHFPPAYDQGDTFENEFAANPEEWIELFHRGDMAKDLSGWELGGGIGFTFPGGTVMEPGSFLVVARDNAALRAKYPDITIVGDFDGRLGNNKDEIILKDGAGNRADAVAYVDSGRWPGAADGGGSSLELRDALADNANPAAWAASDESGKSTWTEIQYEGQATEPVRSNNPDNYHEFLMGLLDAGEVLVDDVSVIEDPDGNAVEVIQNGGFSRTNVFTRKIDKWRILGTQSGQGVQDPSAEGNSVLHLAATGAITHTYNTASTTFADSRRINPTKTYRISLRAKWLRGSPQLNTRLYLNRLAKTHILPIPDRLGSPGAENGSRVENLGPTLDGLRHHPSVPGPHEAVRIQVDAMDPQGVDTVELWYRHDGGLWESLVMTAVSAPPGRYEAAIPPAEDDTVVQFYVRAADAAGAVATAPAAGSASRALYRVRAAGNRSPQVDHLDLIMLSADHEAMRRPEHAVSNGRVLGTLIAAEEIFYDAAARLRSSPYGRPGNRAGFNVHVGKETPFRGVHQSISIDRGVVMPNGTSSGHQFVGVGASTNELVINQIAQGSGAIPTTYDDVIFIHTPRPFESSLAQLRLARYGGVYLDSQYENGGDGTVHKFELIYYPTQPVTPGDPESLKSNYNAVNGIDIQDMRDDKEAYRYNFIISNNRDKDDFTGIIRLGEAFSSRTDAQRRERAAEVMDLDQWMRVFAFQSLIGVADTYNMGLAHNLLIYTRPDGKTLPFPWDMDHGFYYTPTADILGVGNSNLAPIIRLPENLRLFCGHLDDIINSGYNLDYLRPFIDELNAVSERDWADFFTSYIERRRNHVLAEIKRTVPSAPFRILTNGGLDFTSEAPVLTLNGQGWVQIRAVRNETTEQLLDLRWTGVDTWEADVPLLPGENVFALQSLNFRGEPLGSVFSPGSDSITITFEGDTLPAQKGILVVSEIHYHPDPAQMGPNASFTDPEDLEFIELHNVSAHRLDLAGIGFTNGIAFRFPTEPPVWLDAGALGLIVRNEAAFREVYGDAARILASYETSKLDNGGERLTLSDRFGRAISDVRYDDDFPWPLEADGQGYSLVLRRSDAVEVDTADAWRASVARGGSPGMEEDSETLHSWLAGRGVADPMIDANGNGLAELLDYAFGTDLGPYRVQIEGAGRSLSFARRGTADDVVFSLERSADLVTWERMDIEEKRSENDVFGRRVEHWTLPETARADFIRLRLEAP